jgi:hypothetical protein
MYLAFYVFLNGFVDSLKILYPMHLIWKSSRIKKVVGMSFLFNFCIFLVNVYYFYFVCNWFPSTWYFVKWIVFVIWEIPAFATTIYLNRKWCGDLIKMICEKKYGNSKQKFVYAEIAYGTVLVYIFHSIILLLSVSVSSEYISILIKFLGNSWLTAFYLFETRLIYKGYSLNQRIVFLQRRWLYFLGYGTIWGIINLILPYKIFYSLNYQLTNLMILNSIHLKPIKYKKIISLPIFGIVNSITEYFLNLLKINNKTD